MSNAARCQGDETKDIGWPGRLPDTWKLKRLKFLISCAGGGTPNTGSPEFWGGDVPWVSPKDMKLPSISKTEDFLTELGVENSAASKIESGAVLIVVRSGILRHSIPVAINNVVVTINQDLKALLPVGGLMSKYLYWLIEGGQEQLLPLWSKQGCTVESIELEYMLNTNIPVPPHDVQLVIVDYLDRKTKKIDALIAKKKALLEKLAEKRTAVISHAVTQGLDSSVSMRDSGVEHFLFIPSDWRAIRVRHCIDFLTSGSRGWAEYFSPEGSRFLRITNLTRDSIRIDLSDLKFVLPPMGAEVERTAARPGDVVISITADLGCVAVIPECANNSYVSQHLALLRPINKIIQGHWLAYQVLAMSGKSQLLGAGYGGSKVQLSLDDIKDLWIALPPVEEQIKILEYIGRALQKIDEQTKKVSEAIVRLGEYRSALITNAVTGKIDVRGFQVPADADSITECNV